MAIDFPNAPATNATYTVGNRSWIYDGATWNIYNTSFSGSTGGWSSSQTIKSITASTNTPTITDLGCLLTVDTTSGAVTLTINSSLGLTTGQRIDFMWVGAATSVTFSASSVTLNGTPGLKLRARYSAATLVCTASNTYVLVGDLSA